LIQHQKHLLPPFGSACECKKDKNHLSVTASVEKRSPVGTSPAPIGILAHPRRLKWRR